MAIDYVANTEDVPRGTLTGLFYEAVERHPSEVALAYFPSDGPEMESLSYTDVVDRVRACADGIAAMRLLEPGQRAAIISENRPGWAISDYACLCARIEDVPIHSTLTDEQVAFIMKDADVGLVFAENAEQVEKIRSAARMNGAAVRIVVFDVDGDLGDDVTSWARLLENGRSWEGRPSEAEFRERALGADPEDVATILYTSGTTGRPKGVMLTHDNLYSNVRASASVLAAAEGDSTLSFLPLSHVFQRMVDYLHFWKGVSIAYAHSVYTVADDLKVTRPSIVCGVPRVYEKVYAAITGVTGIKKKLVDWASKVGSEWSDVKLAGEEPGFGLRMRHALADRIVYRKVREGVGGKIRYFGSGSAPLSPKINKFFYGMGIMILEGYGLTETSPVTNVNTFEDFRIGTVGKAIPGTEIKIAEDGEILIRGRQVMKGYYNLPDATAKAIDEEGWFRTGDVGEIDDDGFLKITDRKKDLMKTSGGKYVAPQQIENQLKTHPLVEQAVVIGDGRKFCSVMIVPDFIALKEWAAELGLSVSEPSELIARREVQEHFESEVNSHLHGLARYEMPKKIGLLADPFTIEDGSLTPTQKVKRNVVEERQAELIEAFYDPANEDRNVFVGS